VVRADRVDREQGELPAPRTSLSRPRVPLREDQDRLAGLPRVAPGRAADPIPAEDATDARRGRRRAVRRSEVAVRAQARRDPGARDAAAT
jgi:hypothetical protein